MSVPTIQLTRYSHGAGCGCKIAPDVLETILKSNYALPDHNRLLVGNHSKDDAAVYDLGNNTALISTTDFFMPIVDDPYDFGRIASANAISDVYAMEGRPILAIAILGWPVNTLDPTIARMVIEGSRSICMEAGIPLAGGHSIDSPEPIFGLAVNGIVDPKHIKRNDTARPGDTLFLTKKLGVGILTTAEKKGLLKPEHQSLAARQMEKLNKAGESLGKIEGVSAMTDVTGFGLLGHLTEMCEGSQTSAEILFDQVPLITTNLMEYVEQGSIPGGTERNLRSYAHKVIFIRPEEERYARAILADPQTSGGLLIAVNKNAIGTVKQTLETFQVPAIPIGRILPKEAAVITVR